MFLLLENFALITKLQPLSQTHTHTHSHITQWGLSWWKWLHNEMLCCVYVHCVDDRYKSVLIRTTTADTSEYRRVKHPQLLFISVMKKKKALMLFIRHVMPVQHVWKPRNHVIINWNFRSQLIYLYSELSSSLLYSKAPLTRLQMRA